jgi:hypothetical protein
MIYDSYDLIVILNKKSFEKNLTFSFVLSAFLRQEVGHGLLQARVPWLQRSRALGGRRLRRSQIFVRNGSVAVLTGAVTAKPAEVSVLHRKLPVGLGRLLRVRLLPRLVIL